MQDEDTDDDSVADEFVADYGLDEEGQKHEGQNLGIDDEEEFLEVLAEFVVVVAEDGLHEDAAGHGDEEEDDFGDSRARRIC